LEPAESSPGERPDGWRVFFTQPHGDNHTGEVLPARPRGDE
jgi:hypothetical protein